MAKGKKTGGGSRAGAPNKATAEVKAIAQKYCEPGIAELARLGGLIKDKPGSESESARVAAIKEILDRGYGKATQPMQHSVDEGLESLLDRISKTGGAS